jgi:DNA-binding IclR family transcriptional regulator
MKRSVERRYYPTPALEKGLDILELFAGTPEGLTVSEAARRLERTVSEIFRMVLCLEQRGYLAQSQDSERYHLTLRLFRLAQEHPPTKRLVIEALPTMHQLAHRLRQSCHLGVLDGGHVVILAQVDSPESTGFYVKVGSKVDLMHAATGHVILAHQSEDGRRRAIEEWRAETKKRKPADLDEHLARIFARGFERRASYEVAGLTVPFVKRLEDTVSLTEVIAAVREASQQISESMGAFPVTKER